MSDRLAADDSCGWQGCAWIDMGVGVWGCKMSDIWDASGLMSDKLSVTFSEAS